MFRVGQKVVCVDVDSGGGIWWPDERPIVGGVYTITSTYIDADGDECLKLAEIRRHPEVVLRWGKHGYAASRFRPVVERKTDISIFTAMLTPKKQKVRA